jgi:uncharacterized protein (TIGR02246 family)
MWRATPACHPSPGQRAASRGVEVTVVDQPWPAGVLSSPVSDEVGPRGGLVDVALTQPHDPGTDATVALPGDTYLRGRQAIRDWMARAFEGKWRGTRVLGRPLEIKYVNDDIIVMFSQGGAYRPGETEVSADDAIRGMWVFTRQGPGWTIIAYENTPVRATIPLSGAGG